jgi:RNA-directed DNA polymerase
LRKVFAYRMLWPLSGCSQSGGLAGGDEKGGPFSCLENVFEGIPRQRVRKYGKKLLIRPTPQSVRSVLEKARQLIGSCRGVAAAVLIRKLNPLLRGWANYHRHVVSKRVFDRVGLYLRRMLWRWARRNHPNKSRGWTKRRYHSADQHGAFSVWTSDREGRRRVLSAYSVARTVIERHIKVRGSQSLPT